MYGWIFGHLPGPLWLRVVESVALIALVVWALFTYAFPWAQEAWNLGGANVG